MGIREGGNEGLMDEAVLAGSIDRGFASAEARDDIQNSGLLRARPAALAGSTAIVSSACTAAHVGAGRNAAPP